jgi:uncharacterized protein (DUF1015 family)
VAAGVANETNQTNAAGHFLVALFSADQMRILDYNRVVSTLNANTPEQIIKRASHHFELDRVGKEPYKPKRRGEFGMYLDGNWYRLAIREGGRPQPGQPQAGQPQSERPQAGQSHNGQPQAGQPTGVAGSLDIAVLHDRLLEPVFGITDPKSNPDIEFVGGARGLLELQERADRKHGAAFAVYPCRMEELFAVADAGELMPPKSTWFDPKPRSGLFIHRL